jgi:hypothetical protein
MKFLSQLRSAILLVLGLFAITIGGYWILVMGTSDGWPDGDRIRSGIVTIIAFGVIPLMIGLALIRTAWREYKKTDS